MRHTHYDAIAENYDRRYDGDDYAGVRRALLDFIGTTSQRTLEVGCGTGHWLELLGSRSVRVVGLDRSAGMLSVARVKVPDIPLVRGCAEDLPFIAGSMHHLFCINAHHHFANKRRFFYEAIRVLRPGGSLMTIALDPHTGADQWWIYDYFEGTLAIDKERYPSCAQIRDWMRDAGFRDTYSCAVQHEADTVPAAEALRTGMLTAAYTSQLAVLSQEELAEGIGRIQAAHSKDAGLHLTADLHVYATFGRV